MLNKSRPYFKKADLLVAALVLLTALASILIFFTGLTDKPAKTAEIRVKGELKYTLDLSEAEEAYTFTVDGNFPVTLEVSSEGVKFTDSACPDKLCIHSGLITSNRSAACLPAGVSVTVKGEEAPLVDGIVG